MTPLAALAPALINRPLSEEVIPEQPPIILRKWGWYIAGKRLCGDVFGHPNFPDGAWVVTSRVQFIDETVGIAKTLNTVYILRDKA